MKTYKLPSFFKATAVLLLFTLFGFQQSNAQLNLLNNTGCFVYLGEYFGNGCTPCNNPNGAWYAPGPHVIPIPPCLIAVSPTPGWIAIKYAVAPLPGPFIGAGSYSNNPFNAPCAASQNNSRCGFNQVVATWLNGNTVQIQ